MLTVNVSSAVTSWTASTDHEVTDQVVCAQSSSHVSTRRVRRHRLMLPYVTRMVNSSLRDARVPDSQKHAIVTPLLMRPGLDTKLQAGVQWEVRVEGHRACSGQATSPVPDRQWVVTALPVSLPPSSFDGNSHVAHSLWHINSRWCKPSDATRSTRSVCSVWLRRPSATATTTSLRLRP